MSVSLRDLYMVNVHILIKIINYAFLKNHQSPRVSDQC